MSSHFLIMDLSSSPFRSSHKNVFGWGVDGSCVLQEIYTLRELTPEFIQVNGYDGLPRPLCKLIVEYAEHPIIFEVWKYRDPHDPTKYAEGTNVNWYGEFTYGTSWFRGCKIWLTPQAGFVFNKVNHAANMRSVEGKEEIVESFCEAFKRHMREIKSYDPKVIYNTSRKPFRERAPIDFVREKLTQFVSFSQDRLPVYNECKSKMGSFLVWILHNVIKRDGQKQFAYRKGTSERATHTAEGGDSDICCVWGQNTDHIATELQKMQEFAEKQFGVLFEWV